MNTVMDDYRKIALRQCHPDLRTSIIVRNCLPRLYRDAGGFLTDVEKATIIAKESDVFQVDELIEVLVKKENKDFDHFCVILEEDGHCTLSNRLKEVAGIGKLLGH